ncbi:MAG: hypothetical protein IPI95_00850 [Flavobacteriales bacterium]|nr:hypothetical protein [Flavobacteriales bacterium]
MLIKGLYTVTRTVQEGDRITASVHLDEHHAVFKGHFPDRPVMPGVCTLQIVTGTAGRTLGAIAPAQQRIEHQVHGLDRSQDTPGPGLRPDEDRHGTRGESVGQGPLQGYAGREAERGIPKCLTSIALP